MQKSPTSNRYIPQGRSACKPFSKITAGNSLVAVFMLVLAIVAISRPVASAEARNCNEPGPSLSRFAPAVPPRPVTQEPFFDANGAPVTLGDYKGRGVVLNFWATWCPPCIKELPALAQLRKTLADDGIEVIALSVDRGGAPVVKEFLGKIGITNLDILIDKMGKVSRKLRASGLPTTILIDPDGIEHGRIVGYAEWDTSNAIEFVRRCIGP